MTTTVKDFINTAHREIGVTENPPYSNRVKYWDEFPQFQGEPWCAAFVQACIRTSQAPAFTPPERFYCPSYVSYAEAHNLWTLPTEKFLPGDLLLMAFSPHAKQAGLAEHIGIVVSDDRGMTHTIEGNTSSGVVGSQSNGGGVFERMRDRSVVVGAVAYHQLLAVPTLAPAVYRLPVHVAHGNPFHAPHRTLYLKDPHMIGTDVRWVQWAAGLVGSAVDGDYGPQTDHAVRYFQTQHRLVSDGVVGPLTIAEMLKVTR